jgi:hypothetical protein
VATRPLLRPRAVAQLRQAPSSDAPRRTRTGPVRPRHPDKPR